jgi:putative Holliday junction resolvase
MAASYVIAFDFGLRHIGVAVGQTITGTATPLTTLSARQGVPDWTPLTALVAEWRPARLLVGLPLNMDDTESPMSERTRRFAAELTRRSGLPVLLIDERLTSYAARASGIRNGHAHAAVMIAQTWLADPR